MSGSSIRSVLACDDHQPPLTSRSAASPGCIAFSFFIYPVFEAVVEQNISTLLRLPKLHYPLRNFK
jgi:hypothetical protein